MDLQIPLNYAILVPMELTNGVETLNMIDSDIIEIMPDAIHYFTERTDWPVNKHGNYELTREEFITEALGRGWISGNDT
jgi:hypothetical protein